MKLLSEIRTIKYNIILQFDINKTSSKMPIKYIIKYIAHQDTKHINKHTN